MAIGSMIYSKGVDCGGGEGVIRIGGDVRMWGLVHFPLVVARWKAGKDGSWHGLQFNSEKAGKMKSDWDEPGSGKVIEMHRTFS